MEYQEKFLVIDTNIILIDAYNAVTVGGEGTVVVVPEIAVDELDSKKSLMNELGYHAREFGRILSQATKLDVVEYQAVSLSRFQYEDTIIAVASSSKYPNYEDSDPGIVNDRKIINMAEQLRAADLDVTFMSNDVMCRIRAESLGLPTTEFRIIESTSFDFVRTITISDLAEFTCINGKPIMEVDPEHKPENYNYKIECPHTTQVKLGTISNGTLQVLDSDIEKELRRQDINPANAEQLFLSKALQDTTVNIVICDAKAGSGKTLVALSNGIRQVKKGLYDSLIYIRASVDDVDDVEAVGFLPGLEEKFAVYLHPLQDSLDKIVRSRFKNPKEKGEELEEKVLAEIVKLKASCNITAMTGLGLRGRTIDNAYVIIDEFQNQSKSSAQKTLTRFGKDCKIAIIGSNNQIDNKYLTRYTNGMSTLLDAATKEQEHVKLHAVTLEKVVRGPIAEFAEGLYSKE